MTGTDIGIKWKALAILLLIFALSIGLRLPNLKRPLAKHHEFLPAVILINAESWQQAGGGNKFHFTPIMNYQNVGDKVMNPGPNIDQKGNILYLSLGSGWYIIPYSFFEVFNLAPTPLCLRIINLFFGLITLILCFVFFNKILPTDLRYKLPMLLIGCTIILFSPGVLWYTGNGYTHTTVMLPFIIGASIILFPMFQSTGKITSTRLLLLAVLIVVSLFMDWFIIFIGLCSIALCLYKMKEHSKYLLLAIVIAFSLGAGILLIVWQYASYAGESLTLQYWKLRFFDRSFLSTDVPFFAMLLSICGHYVTAYLPLLAGIFVSAAILPAKERLRIFTKNEKIFICLFGGAVVLYHLTLLNWSYVHEFSVMPSCILVGYIFMRFVFVKTRYFKLNSAILTASLVLFFSVCQYYFINPPGALSLTKLPYNTYEILGSQLRGIDGKYKIFINMHESNPMVEYYAKRNLNNATDTFQVKIKMKEWNLKEAIWVEQKNYMLKRIIHLHKE